jgi:hypothetical protein
MTEALLRPRVVNAEFVIKKVALGPFYFLVFQYSLINNIPPKFHIYSPMRVVCKAV